MDTMEQMLSMLLAGAVEVLDISPDLQQFAVDRYEEVGGWLAEQADSHCDIYPQGSFRLGTVVRPATATGEYDIDLVCRMLIAKEDTSQAQLKDDTGSLLRGYVRWKDRHGHTDGPSGIEARRRCWTLAYSDHGFHLDVLPAIPHTEYPPTGILLTDKQLFHWQHSDPIRYSKWFRGRSEELQRKLVAAAEARHLDVAEVPEWAVRSTLQRVVQVLKWHCMLYFTDNPDDRPPSILLTTLAAKAYRGDTDLVTAARAALAGMGRYIEDRDGKWWVPNPAHEQESFADKWNDYPRRREAFLAWHRDISTTLDDAVAMKGAGLQVVTTRLEKSFGRNEIRLSAQRYGEQLERHRTTGSLRVRPSGLLTTAPTGTIVRNHPLVQNSTPYRAGGGGHGRADGEHLLGRVKRTDQPTAHRTKGLGAETVSGLLTVIDLDRGSGRRSDWAERDRAIVLTAVLAGLRADELVRADVGDIRPTDEGGVIHVHGKGNKDRRIPVERALIHELEAYLDSRAVRFPGSTKRRPSNGGLAAWPATAPLFVGSDGQRITRGTLQYRVLRAFKKAELDSQRARGVLVHGFRHTFATELANADVSVYALMKLLGHESMVTSQRYVDGARTQNRAAAAQNPLYGLIEQSRKP